MTGDARAACYSMREPRVDFKSFRRFREISFVFSGSVFTEKMFSNYTSLHVFFFIGLKYLRPNAIL